MENEVITRADLEKQTVSIKEYIDLKMAPVVKDVGGHSRILYGVNGNNGLSGSVKVLKWGYALLAGVMLFLAEELLKLYFKL